MDIEQLKLILDTVEAAGAGAYTIALLWLGLGALEVMALAAVPISIVVIICRASVSVSTTAQLVKDLYWVDTNAGWRPDFSKNRILDAEAAAEIMKIYRRGLAAPEDQP